MISSERLKIGQYMKLASFEQVLKAMEESAKRIEDAEERLELILQQLETDDIEKGLSGDIEDLLYSVAVTFYAKGVIAGKKIEELCK